MAVKRDDDRKKESGFLIKLPEGKSVTVEDFNHDMQRRKQKSVLIQV